MMPTWNLMLAEVFLLLVITDKRLSYVDGEEWPDGGVPAVYEAKIEEMVRIECPLVPGDCVREGEDPVYLWEKHSQDSRQSLLRSEGRALRKEIERAEDGGFYRCYSQCKAGDRSPWIQLNVFPHLEVPSAGVGVHLGDPLHLLCKASGFPRPEAHWSATGDITAREYLNALPQQDEVVDDYTVLRHLRVEKAEWSMGGTYVCTAHLLKEPGSSDTVDHTPSNLETYYEAVVVYEPPLIAGSSIHAVVGQPATLQCQMMQSDIRLRFEVNWYHIDGPRAIPCEQSTKYTQVVFSPTYTLRIDNVTASDGGWYECRVSSIFNDSEASDSLELIIDGPADRGNGPTSDVSAGYLLEPSTVLPTIVIGFGILVVVVYCTCFKSARRRRDPNIRRETDKTRVPERPGQPHTSTNSDETGHTRLTSSSSIARFRRPARRVEPTKTLTLQEFADKHEFMLTKPR